LILFRLKNTSSKPAGALSPDLLFWSALKIAFLIASQVDIANISGGSPTAFDLWIVFSWLEVFGLMVTLKCSGVSPMAGIL
jgi:hypothetical protein